jgi:hypothetical protein
MSRVLRRPMFRGGIANSEGVGITSGLDTPKRGLVDGPGGYAGDINDILKQQLLEIESRRSYKPPKTSKEIEAEYLSQAEAPVFDPDTGMGVGIPGSYAQNQIDYLQAISSPAYKKAYLAKREKEEADKRKIGEQLGYKFDPMVYGKNIPVVENLKDNNENKIKEEEVSKKQDFKTIYEDLLPIFRASVGPDQDEYTRQKYLELAKFGLNLLKPTPAGVPSSFLSSAAAAAEKPLEGYGNIIERERQAAKVPEALALQQAMKLSEPGAVGKAIRDLIQTGAAKNEKEALAIYLKSDSASQKKQAMEEKALLASRLQGYQALTGVKDQAIIDQLTDLVYQDPSLAYKIKGERSKYKPEAYEEGAIYIDKGKIVKYKKGLFYNQSEPGFKG